MVFAKSSKWGRRIRTGLRIGKAVYQTAAAAYSLASGVAALVNSESKYLDTSMATPATSTAFVQCLNLIGQGTDYYQRVGNTIRISQLNIRGLFTSVATTPAYGVNIRVVIFIDRESCSGSNPAYTDLFTGSSLIAPYNLLTAASRFKILYDKLFTLDLSTRTSVHFRYFKKFTFGGKKMGPRRRRLVYRPSRIGGHLIRFDGALNTLGATDTGNVYIMWQADQATTYNNVDCISRLRYYDN